MSTTRLHVKMNCVDGALIRLLGLAGRRGFDITSVEARRDEHGWYEIVLELLGTRSVITLQRQIAKLYDVRDVQIMPEQHVAHLRLAGDEPRRAPVAV